MQSIENLLNQLSHKACVFIVLVTFSQISAALLNREADGICKALDILESTGIIIIMMVQVFE